MARRKVKPYRERGYSSKKILMKCKCPKCEEIHETKIYWTGRGIPPINCKRCKENMGIEHPANITEHRVRNEILQSL